MSTALRSISVLSALGLIGWGLYTSHGLSDARWLTVLLAAWALLIFGTRIQLPDSLPTFNRSLIRSALIIASVFVIMSAQLVRIQVVERDDIYYRTAVDSNGEVISNPRLTTARLASDRGIIYDRNGVVIADTVRQGKEYHRVYPEWSAYGVVGYYSPLMYGSTGLEATWEQELSGEAGNNPVERMVRGLLGMPQTGANLNLTIDTELQRMATNLLDGNAGSVVVLDAQTGATMVLASNPTYDPNRLFTTGNDPEASAYWEALLDDPSTPLVTRSNLGIYIPGSTFKTVTGGIAIEEGFAEPDTVYEDDGELVIEGRVLTEFNRPDETRDQWTLAEGIAWSLNVVLAQVGLQIGGQTYWDYGPRFGFGETIPYDIPVAQSQIANSREALSDPNMVADTGFGQGQLQVTPLHLAMITASWANGGRMMQPYLVETVTDANGDVTQSTSPSVWKTPVSPDTADQVEAMMVNSVENGSIQNGIVDGYVVGGKTGTAETGDGTAHSLFIGFIGDPEPRYAVAVVLEGGAGGLNSAVAIGRDILVATIQRPSD